MNQHQMNQPIRKRSVRACAGMLLILGSLQLDLAATLPANYADLDHSKSEMRPLIERYAADRGNILRFYNIPSSADRRARLRKFFEETKGALEAQNFDAMSQDGKVDYILFRNDLDHELRKLALDEKEEAENDVYLPFASLIIQLEEARQHMNPLDPVQAAQTLGRLNKDVEAARQITDSKLRAETGIKAAQERRIVGNRAATEAAQLRGTLRTWFTFYNGYDPMFTWWDEEAYRTVDTTLQSYATSCASASLGSAPHHPDPRVAAATAPGGRGSLEYAPAFSRLPLRRRAPAQATISLAIPSAVKA